MIANLLPNDDNHIVGGSVEVNGVCSRNKDIVWPVRRDVFDLIWLETILSHELLCLLSSKECCIVR